MDENEQSTSDVAARGPARSSVHENSRALYSARAPRTIPLPRNETLDNRTDRYHQC